jgi:hypothetical protein
VPSPPIDNHLDRSHNPATLTHLGRKAPCPECFPAPNATVIQYRHPGFSGPAVAARARGAREGLPMVTSTRPTGNAAGRPGAGACAEPRAPHVPDGGATGAGQRGGQALAPRGGRSCHAVAPQRGPALQGAGLSAVFRTAAVSGSGRRRPTRRSGIPKRVSGHGCGACSPPSTGVPPSGSQMKRSALSSAPWPR